MDKFYQAEQPAVNSDIADSNVYELLPKNNLNIINDEEVMVEEVVQTNVPSETGTENNQDTPPSGRLKEIGQLLQKNKVAVAAGTVTVASLAVNPIGDTLRIVGEVAPYVGVGMAAAEAAWIGGAAMMLAAAGKRIKNPFKIKSQMSQIVHSAANSPMFKTGLAVNTAAALAEFVIPAVAVTENMPVKSWGVLAFGCLDLWATVVIRKLIWRGLRRHTAEAQSNGID